MASYSRAPRASSPLAAPASSTILYFYGDEQEKYHHHFSNEEAKWVKWVAQSHTDQKWWLDLVLMVIFIHQPTKNKWDWLCSCTSLLYPCYSKGDWQMISQNGITWKTVRMQSLRPILRLRNQNLHYENSPQIFLQTLKNQKHQSLSVLILGSLWFLFFSKLLSLYNLPQTHRKLILIRTCNW